MSLLDADAIAEARRDAGVLPTKLARQLQGSVDTTTGIVARDAKDANITLADLGHLASALGVEPRNLLHGACHTIASRGLCARLVALLHRDGAASLTWLATRLATGIDELLGAIHAYNAEARGLKIMRWHDSVGLVPDPVVDLPPRGVVGDRDAAQSDRFLWQVIDRAIPSVPPKATLMRLRALERDGLVTLFEGQWRPTDEVVETLDLTDWDTVELLTFVRVSADLGDRVDRQDARRCRDD